MALQKKSGSKKLCFFRTALMKLEKKNNFSDSKKKCALTLKNHTSLAVQKNQALFFPYCSHETQTSTALQKTIFQAQFFFSHASCQICQLHLVTSFKLAPTCAAACNTKLRMP